MFQTVLKAIFGSRNDRLLKDYRRTLVQINALEPEMQKLSDDGLRAKTAEYKRRVENGEALDTLLPEAFATVREAGKRVLNMRHFDEQMIGGMALHNGKISEMRTGEGKTLVATLPSYLNALSGKGVHVITVNDYLASRDANWMGRIHRALGLTVGVNLPQMSSEDKRAAFACDITYGTNNEFGFDYLRDNMVQDKEERVMRGLNFAIVDEVDSILIDEARTPLIISGQAEDSTETYRAVNVLIPKMIPQQEEKGPGDFWADLKQHSVLLSEEGHEKAEDLLTGAGLLPEGASLYDPSNIALMHHFMAGLRAHALFHRNQHYIVENNEIVIIDEFTGRKMSGRRWSDGLHQAVEAKEGVRIQNESQTLASITFQNYFRLYGRLSGMTGTADTEAFEFQSIYNLETVLIPTHRKMVRKDQNDKVYMTLKEKYKALAEDVKARHEAGQPALVGTTSVENSEIVSQLFNELKLPHEVLNAKNHLREAQIIAQAGKPGAITVATNMAGRGTDIILGGNVEHDIEEIRNDESLGDSEKERRIQDLRGKWDAIHSQVVASGGLFVIGTERHESRRIDNQLRGRSGRQGDPGETRFYLSFEDPLLKIFGGDRMKSIMATLKIPEGEALETGMTSRSIEGAQRKVEARNFDIRKQLLEYDDVANDQRKVIYQQRNELLESEDVAEAVNAMRHDVIAETVNEFAPPESLSDNWNIDGLQRRLADTFNLSIDVKAWYDKHEDADAADLQKLVIDTADREYRDKFKAVSDVTAVRRYERAVLLQHIDTHWREHLASLDYLRQGIHLRGYAQKQPKQEYKREAFELFSRMLDSIKRQVSTVLLGVRVATQEEIEEAERRAEEAQAQVSNLQYHHADASNVSPDDDPEAAALAASSIPADQQASIVEQYIREGAKVGRNDPCPCGSGKKFKFCHGELK